MPHSLKTKTLHGLFWSFLERIGQQGTQFIISIILARLVLPKEFGLIAMLLIFVEIARSFLDSGFGQALIQKQDATHVDECSIFYFNILVGFLLAGLLCLVAPWIAGFYHQPLLVLLTYALSLNMIIDAFGLVQTALLTKQVDFKTQLKVSMLSTVISGAIGITMAFKGYGVWSLVAQSLVSNLFRTISLWFFTTWRPSLIFSFNSLRGMFAFGSKILCAGLIGTIFDNIYLIVIGKIFSAAELGFYSHAKRLQQFPATNLTGIIQRVTFPVFSSVQDDKVRLKSGARKVVISLAMVNFPMMIGLAVVARPLVSVLLTDKWLPCVPYLQLLCVVGILYPLHAININILLAQGRSDLNLWITVFKNIIKVAILAITWQWGIKAIIWGQVVVSLLCYFVNCHYTNKLIKYSAWEQINDLSPYLGLAVIMGVGIYSFEYAITGSTLLLLFVQISTGIALFIGLGFIFRLFAFKEGYQLFRQNVHKVLYGA